MRPCTHAEDCSTEGKGVCESESDGVVEGARACEHAPYGLAGKLPVAPKNTAAQRQIEATDREIDRLVYELYELTDEEIAIVEEATRS